MKDTKTDAKTSDQELNPFVGMILVGGISYLIGREILNKISSKHEEDEKPTSQYNTELEALRRLFREGLI